MSPIFRPGKMLICMVARHRGEQIVAAAKAAGARGGTIALGRSTGDNAVLRALSLADVTQDIVFTLLGAEAPEVTAAVVEAARKLPKKLQGFALVLDVEGMLTRLGPNTPSPRLESQETRSAPMESGYTLITIIVNHGYADDVMAAARKAGATGGTILNARGTGTEADVKFFGISLVPEKEMLHIVTSRDKAEAIVAAVNAIPNLCAPGGGIVYRMNVEEFITLGQ